MILRYVLPALAAAGLLWLPPPTPLEVRCEEGATPDVPPAPLGSVAEWVARGPEWAAGVLAILTEERILRAGERDCLARLRARGVIR